MGGQEHEEEPEKETKAAMSERQIQTFGDVKTPEPLTRVIPPEYRDDMESMFATWSAVRPRNATLSRYYDMKNALKELGISIPEGMLDVNCMVGWCKKAVDARSVRSIFDGFVFQGVEDEALKRMVCQNRLRTLYNKACRSMLTHGVSAFTVMSDKRMGVKVRAFSANQFSVLWDKDAERVKCGIVCADVDNDGNACKYVAHFPDAVLTFERDGKDWACKAEDNALGRPMIEVMAFDTDLDRPLGHSLLTPEIIGIVDKAMRDVLRMEVGAEFFTYPQRYVLGAADSLFGDPPEGAMEDGDGGYVDEDGNPVYPVPNSAKKLHAYMGALLAIGRDADGELPTVGQFSPGSADNFTRVFENDAQRFSGATLVPLNQLGVLSNNYTSSDALGATNNPLILAVEDMNRENAEVLEEIARMMMAVNARKSIDKLTDEQYSVQAFFKDPSLPTISACADAWTKIGSLDADIVGTPLWYEFMGQPQATIARIEAQKRKAGVIQTLNQIAEGLKGGESPSGDGA